MYADDTSFLLRAKECEDLNERVVECTESVDDWFIANGLNLNKDKTKNVVFSLRHSNKQDNHESVKFLGITLDPKLTFEQHVGNISKRAASGVFVLRSLAKTVDPKVCLTAYHALVHSVCVYGLLTWGHSPHAARVFSIQRRAVRVLAGIGYREEARPYFEKFEILTLPSQYILESLLFVRQNIDKFESSQDVHSHDIRSRTDLRIDFLRLKRSWNATLHYAPAFFNKLPVRVRELPIKQYKIAIKAYLLKKMFYNFNDFLSCDVTDF